jgi:hypothetical protein
MIRYLATNRRLRAELAEAMEAAAVWQQLAGSFNDECQRLHNALAAVHSQRLTALDKARKVKRGQHVESRALIIQTLAQLRREVMH